MFNDKELVEPLELIQKTIKQQQHVICVAVIY